MSTHRRSDQAVPVSISPHPKDRSREELYHDRRELSKALGKAILRIHELEEKVYRDPLTGESNRNLFDERFGELVETAHDTGEPLALLVADIDGLKRANDTLGHQTGDQLIKAGAAGLREAAREGDLVIRMGGDELCVVLPGFTPMKDQTEQDLFETTKARFAKSTEQEINGMGLPEELRLGMSYAIGILQPGETAEEFYHRVDAMSQSVKDARKAELAAVGAVFHDDRTLPQAG